MTYNPPFEQLKKTILSFRYKHDLATIFEDFLTLAACAISNSANMSRWEEREALYMQTIARYTKEEACLFRDMLFMLVDALEIKPDDYLGSLFMELEISNSWRGQFFTPYPVAYAMARMTMEDQLKEKLEKGEVVKINDCAVGGGVTLIAAFQVIAELGYNPQKVAKFYAGDIDIRAVKMTYIQLSLLGAHATVWHMDTITMKHWDTWLSPFVFLAPFEVTDHTPSSAGTSAITEPTPAELTALPEFKDMSFEQLSLF